MKDIFKLSLTLALICAIAGASLAATYSVTSKIIAERQQAELNRALGELLPDADKFEEVTKEDIRYYLATKAGKNVGAIMLSAGGGYGGPINLLVSIDMSGKVRAVRVTEHRETAGIGNKVEEASFLRQFVDKTPADKLAVGQDIQTVSGATISARGVTAGVKNALQGFEVHLLGLEAPSETFDLSKVKDGVYKSEAGGFKSAIKVEVTVAAGKITKVRVVHGDTPEVADYAADVVAQRIVDKQNWKVDAVSGATITSDAIMEAVKSAIPEPGVVDVSAVPDGKYIGEGPGLFGPIKVEVSVATGKITAIKVVTHKETDYIANPAFAELTTSMISKQSVKVDTVSNATISSQGFIEAVYNALTGTK